MALYAALVVKNLPASAGDLREFNPWVGKILRRRKWRAAPSSVLAWRILWTEEPGGLYSTQGRKVSDMIEAI